MAVKSVQLKISISVIFLLLMISAVTAGSLLFIQNNALVVVLPPVFTAFVSMVVLNIILRYVVVNKIYKLEKEIDLVSEGSFNFSFLLKSNDEFEELAERLNKMFTSMKDRHERERNTLFEEITILENDKYLQNVNDGLLFVDYGQIISNDYSRSLVDIFDREEIGGQHLSDFLYPQKEEQHFRRKKLEKFLIGLFNNPERFDSIDDSINPLHNIWISRNDGRRIQVDGSYRKIEDRGSLVQIMIIFKDRTDEGILEKKLEEKEMRSNFELDSVISILRSGPGPFLQYIDESHEFLAQFRLDILDIHNIKTVNRSFRAINSMKCSAAYFDFKAVEKLCHNLEDILSGFRSGNFNRKEALDIIIDDIYVQFEHVKLLIRRFQEFLSTAEGKIYETSRNKQDHFFDSLKIMMTRNADYLEKQIDFVFRSDFPDFPLIQEIKNPVIQLLRNAVDHGIELPAQRMSVGKIEQGKIQLSIVKTEEGGAAITIEDDGGGMDFEKLREIAVENGFIKKEENPGQGNLIRALFSSGFSIKKQIDRLSGRGVGLDAVKEDISRIGGKITVKTDRQKGSRFTILLPAGLF